MHTKQSEQSASYKLVRLMNERRFVYHVPPDAFVEGHGFRVSICIEGEKGHFPTGSLDVLSKDQKTRLDAFNAGKTVPWFWGHTLSEAVATCELMNQKLGYDAKDVAMIVASTMG